jgi:4-hydroxy-3-methylbut-2-enyl diphosphate reductase IspH
VADDFPDAGVVTVTPETGPRDDLDKWLTDIVYFLSHGISPEELSNAERKRLGVHSRAFSLMNDSLYHKSADRVL